MTIGKFIDSRKDALVEEALKGRHRDLNGFWFYLAAALAVETAVYHIYTAYFGTPFALLFRNIRWMLIAVLIFFYFPVTKRSPLNHPAVFDIVCALASIGLGMYVVLNFQAIASRAGAPVPADIILGAILVLLAMEAGRRTVGWPIVVIAAAKMPPTSASPIRSPRQLVSISKTEPANKRPRCQFRAEYARDPHAPLLKPIL